MTTPRSLSQLGRVLLGALVSSLAVAMLLAPFHPIRAADTPEYLSFGAGTLNRPPDLGRQKRTDLPNLGSSLGQFDTAVRGAAKLSAGKRKSPEIQTGQMQELANSFRLSVQDERVLVTLTMLDESAADNAVTWLPVKGAQIVTRHGRWIDAWVPVSKLQEVSELPGVSLVHRPIPVLPLDSPQLDNGAAASTGLNTLAVNTGSHVTAGVVRSNADNWHATGMTGSGISIGILDSFQWAADAQAAGELPSWSVYPLGGQLDYSSPHGTACAEIVHDMAPDAELTFASLTTGSCTDMANFIAGMAQGGINILSSSVGAFHCGAGDGDPANDPIAAAAQQAMSQGMLYFQAAGNQRERHWDGPFAGSGDFHEFQPGNIVNQIGWRPAGFPIVMYMRWNDWPVSDQDYDLYLVWHNGSTWQIIGSSQNWQTGTQPPVEGIVSGVPYNGYYGFAIGKYNADGTQVLDVINWSADFQFQRPFRSLVGPATSEEVIAIAAVDADTLLQENYSSQGPTHGPGGALTGGRAQPKLAGFANVDTYAYGERQNLEFNGTSAATPHAAGAAAVIWGANPCLSAEEVRNILLSRAGDAGASGYDYAYGSGILNLGVPTDRMCNNTASDLVVSFGSPHGIYRLMNNVDWQRLHAYSSNQMTAGDLDGSGLDDVVIDFGPGIGTWRWMNNTQWQNLSKVSTRHILVGDLDGSGQGDVISDFGHPYGIWLWMNNNQWQQLHKVSAQNITTGDFDGNGQDDLAVDFGRIHGIWRWMNNTQWLKLHNLDSNGLESADLDNNGSDEIAIDFGKPHGVWLWANNANWRHLTALSTNLIRSGDLDDSGQTDLLVDFGSVYGIWRWMNDIQWEKLHPLSSQEAVLSDVDGSGQTDAVIDFGPPHGIWRWMNNGNWQRLHSLSTEAMTSGHLDAK